MTKTIFTKDGAKKLIESPSKELIEKLDLEGWKQSISKKTRTKVKE